MLLNLPNIFFPSNAETLVHSTLESCNAADFSFRVFFNMQENTVYVKQRPHLYKFLEKVVELFHVVIFTASHSIYASQLLDILDPDGKFISQRFYRDSCILLDGIYTKDLTVLGLDLAKVAIIDNCPQVLYLSICSWILTFFIEVWCFFVFIYTQLLRTLLNFIKNTTNNLSIENICHTTDFQAFLVCTWTLIFSVLMIIQIFSLVNSFRCTDCK